MSSMIRKKPANRFDLSSFVRLSFWILFFTFILLSWAWLFIRNEGSIAISTSALSSNFAAALHTSISWPDLAAMWALMVLAMMLPTLLPMLRVLGDIVSNKPRASFVLSSFIGGYVIVWLFFSFALSGVQRGLTELSLVDPGGALLSPIASVFLLILSGLYQFSNLKQACLKSCQVPMFFFMSNWRDGIGGAALMGLRHGAICVGCCWALMLLGFVGGLMNLVWMGIATVLMVVEKWPAVGALMRPLIGLGLIALGMSYGAYFLVL